MKLFILLAAVFCLTVSADSCSKKKNGELYKGRLEVKGLCMNYTIRAMEGLTDTSMITPAWTDPGTGKSYTNVFALGSPCTFPPTINEGDEFYFRLDPDASQECAVCLAYYPTPPKKLRIKVIAR